MGIADVGIADCAICDFVAPGWDAGEAFVPGASELDYTFVLDESELR